MKKLFLFLIFAAFAVSTAAITPATPKRDSDGYYIISSAEELWGLAQMVNERPYADSANKFYVKLTKDIVVNKNVLNDKDTLSKDTSAYECWPSMGPYFSMSFRGEIDGQGHSISGLVGYRGAGFIDKFGSGTIKNLTIKDSYFFGGPYLGGLISRASSVNVENVTVQATVVSTVGDYVGGLVANSGYGTFRDCVFKGYISAVDTSSDGVGGIAGDSYALFINCENQGRIEGYDAVGGIVGILRNVVLQSRNTGMVRGTKRVGGVVGQNFSQLAFCSNEGPVTAINEVGGVVGSNNGAALNLSNTADVQGDIRVGGVVGESTTLISGSYNTGTVTGAKYIGGILGTGASSMRGNYHGASSCFNIGSVKGNSYVGALVGNRSRISNSIALASTALTLAGSEDGAVAGDTLGGEFASSGAFTDGTVLKVLDAKSGSATWIQGADYPELKPVSNPEKNADYYEISNASELLWFSYMVSGGASNKKTKAVLTDDIVFHKDLVKSVKALDSIRPSYEEWKPIYNRSTKYGTGFEGHFDGQGHTISGLYIYYKDEYGDTLGLFKILEYTADVRNVGVSDTYFSGQRTIGGIAGVTKGKIVNAHFSGYIRGNSEVGGIAGRGYYILNSIRDCYNEGEITGGSDVGGIVGSTSGSVSRSYNIGPIGAIRPKSVYTTSMVGGISANAANISNCYNWGTIDAYHVGGGIASKANSKIENSYNVGEVIEYDSVSYKLNVSDSLGGNNYILKDSTNGEPLVGITFKEKTAEEFADGSVVDLLNAETGYDMWVQGDKYPQLEKPAKPAIKDGAFLISNASELYWFMEYVNDSLADRKTKAKLADDIVLRGRWTPIGYMYSAGFQGEFDGQGHTISGVNVFEEDTSRIVVGFFAKLSKTALVKNLTLKNATVKGGRYVVGGIVGENFGRVENCTYEGSVIGKNHRSAGMIAGYDDGSLFGNIGICTSNCDSILVRSDTVNYRVLNVNRKEVANFVIAASEKDNKKFKDGSFALEANDGIKDAIWKQGEGFPYLGVEIPEIKDDAYQIGNLGQLFWAFNYANVESSRPIILTADIVVNKNVLKSDCAVSGDTCNFSNSAGFKKLKNMFDGNGHKISGLYGDFFIDTLRSGAQLKNLKIEDSYFNSTIFYNDGSVYKCTLDVKAGREYAGARPFYYTGALAAYNRGSIRDVEVKGSLVNKKGFVTAGAGGIVGQNLRWITNSRFSGVLEADTLVGGIAAYNQGSIDSTVFDGSVKGRLFVGGIAGRSQTSILNSVSNGVVAGARSVGGIVGETILWNKSVFKLKNSYSASAVKGSMNVGGLVGYMQSPGDSIIDCFNIGTVIADSIGGGLVGFMQKGHMSYSFNYATDKKLSAIGMIAGSMTGYATPKNCYAFYDGEAPLFGDHHNKDKFEDVSFKTAKEFADGTVLELLTKGRSSYRWIQGKKYPVFGKMTINPVVVPEDSLKLELGQIARTPLFGLNVLSRNIQVFGAPANSEFMLLDMQGREISRGRTVFENFEIPVPHAGSYLLKVGNHSRQVNVK